MNTRSLDYTSKQNFCLQQGFRGEVIAQQCSPLFSALLFQPRIVALVLAVAIFLQEPMAFLALAAVLWWGAFFPHWNLFDLLYNRTLGRRSGPPPVLPPAPPPRRFAQALAGAFACAAGLCLMLRLEPAAYLIETAFALAVVALAFGRFCLGSYVFHLLRGRARFARRTLPWARGGEGAEGS